MEGKGICETDPTSEERKMRARGISAGDEKFLTKLKEGGIRIRNRVGGVGHAERKTVKGQAYRHNLGRKFFQFLVEIDHKLMLGRKQTTISKVDIQFSSVAQSCLTLCNTMNRSTPGLPVHHQLRVDIS